MGPSVDRLRKTHKKVPDHAVHTVKLGRLCLWTCISTTLKNCVNKRTVQDGKFTFVLGTFPDKKILPSKNSGTETLIYRYKVIQNFSTGLFYIDTKLIAFVRTEIEKADH